MVKEKENCSSNSNSDVYDIDNNSQELSSNGSNWSLGLTTNPPILEDMGLSPLIGFNDREEPKKCNKSRRQSKRTSKVSLIDYIFLLLIQCFFLKVLQCMQDNQNSGSLNNKCTEEFFVYKRKKFDIDGKDGKYLA